MSDSYLELGWGLRLYVQPHGSCVRYQLVNMKAGTSVSVESERKLTSVGSIMQAMRAAHTPASVELVLRRTS